MPKSAFSKTSAILIGLSLLAVIVSPIFAADELIRAEVGPVAKLGASMSATKFASRAAALKTRLQTFKDQKKAQVAERVNINLNAINQNHTAQMQKNLSKMSTILDKLENRVNQAALDIKNPADTNAAIISARATIATASAAVTAQSLRDYTIQITSETRIGIDAKLQRDKLHADLVALRKAVIDARQAVVNAIKVAKSGSAVKESTNSGQQ